MSNFAEKIYLDEYYEKLLQIEDYEKIEKIIEESLEIRRKSIDGIRDEVHEVNY